MLKKTYSCDICRDPKPLDDLMGCNFRGLTEFKLDAPLSTEGIHICKSCLRQLKSELAKVNL